MKTLVKPFKPSEVERKELVLVYSYETQNYLFIPVDAWRYDEDDSGQMTVGVIDASLLANLLSQLPANFDWLIYVEDGILQANGTRRRSEAEMAELQAQYKADLAAYEAQKTTKSVLTKKQKLEAAQKKLEAAQKKLEDLKKELGE